jgi:oligoribonuclease NrnB/cAMP/cGMP phosphodiesterase (DHH superfamily)
MKTLLMTHVDLDGVGNIILAKYFKLPVDDYILVDYDQLDDLEFNQSLRKYTNIYLTDLNIQDETYNVLVENNISFLVFDHHQTTEKFSEDPRVTWDITQSGTKLFYNYLSKGKRVLGIVRDFVELVDTYDMWRLESPLREDSENLNRVFFHSINYQAQGYQKYEPFIKNQFKKFERYNNWKFLPSEVDKINIAKAKEVQDCQEAENLLTFREDSKGKVFGLFMARRNISKVCSYLLCKYQNLDYIICINTYNQGTDYNKVAVRSREFNTVSLRNIEGHAHASGGIFSRQFLTDLWAGKINELGYKE